MRTLLVIMISFTFPLICIAQVYPPTYQKVHPIPEFIYVPGDYSTIQEAIDAAEAGYVILVAPGTYMENIDFKGNAITVRSDKDGNPLTHDPCPWYCTIDGGNPSNPDYGSVVTFNSDEGPDSVLMGFTLTNGSGNLETEWGDQDHHGGGVYCKRSSPTISGNIITGNTLIVSVIYGCTGGGIYCIDNSSPLIVNNLIYGNSAPGQNLGSGGGIFCGFASCPKIVNCTISDNHVDSIGGGLLTYSDSFPEVVNTILWDNHADYSGHEIGMTSTSYPSSLKISYSVVEGGNNLPGVYKEGTSALNWGPEGMIDSDPLFVNSPNGDFHLTFNSPCRGSGDNSAVTELYDFEGDPRIYQGTVDIGADEFHRHLYCTGGFTPGGSIEGKFVGLPGTSPVGLFIGSGVMDPPLHHMWGDFYLEAPWFLVGPLGSIPADGVMKISTALPSIPAPYDIPMQALIGWELSNLFVLNVR